MPRVLPVERVAGLIVQIAVVERLDLGEDALAEVATMGFVGRHRAVQGGRQFSERMAPIDAREGTIVIDHFARHDGTNNNSSVPLQIMWEAYIRINPYTRVRKMICTMPSKV